MRKGRRLLTFQFTYVPINYSNKAKSLSITKIQLTVRFCCWSGPKKYDWIENRQMVASNSTFTPLTNAQCPMMWNAHWLAVSFDTCCMRNANTHLFNEEKKTKQKLFWIKSDWEPTVACSQCSSIPKYLGACEFCWGLWVTRCMRIYLNRNKLKLM